MFKFPKILSPFPSIILHFCSVNLNCNEAICHQAYLPGWRKWRWIPEHVWAFLNASVQLYQESPPLIPLEWFTASKIVPLGNWVSLWVKTLKVTKQQLKVWNDVAHAESICTFLFFYLTSGMHITTSWNFVPKEIKPGSFLCNFLI